MDNQIIGRRQNQNQNQSSTSTGSILMRDFKILKKLGSGGFGIVIKVHKTNEKFESALKLIPIPRDSDEKIEKTFDEARKLSSISPHQSVIRCIDFWSDSFTRAEHKAFVDVIKPNKDEIMNSFPENIHKLELLCIQMELCGNENLRSWLKKRKGTIDFFANINIFLQIARGISHIHKHGIIHRDLKPSNILFDGKTAKISDLGYSVMHTPGDYYHTKNAGAKLYLAPEQEYGKYGQSVDYFALGLILFELFYPPAQENVGEYTTKLKFSRIIPEDLRRTQPEVSTLILKLISVNSENRPNMDSIIARIKNFGSFPELAPEIQYSDTPILCENCEIVLTGLRYKCSVCHNYHLCDGCADISPILHPISHNLIKIATPVHRFEITTTKNKKSSSGCEHYNKRNCIIQCPREGCGKFFPCRHCHDAAIVGHKLDRHAVKTIQCLMCNMKQFPNDRCILCDIAFAKFVCVPCNLYDDSEDADKLIYHCFDCGICRRKLDEETEYQHCDICSICHPNSKKFLLDGVEVEMPFSEHECEKESGLALCSVCGKSLHDSHDQAVLNSCKHYVHSSCRLKFPDGKTECPVCGNW